MFEVIYKIIQKLIKTHFEYTKYMDGTGRRGPAGRVSAQSTLGYAATLPIDPLLLHRCRTLC